MMQDESPGEEELQNLIVKVTNTLESYGKLEFCVNRNLEYFNQVSKDLYKILIDYQEKFKTNFNITIKVESRLGDCGGQVKTEPQTDA